MAEEKKLPKPAEPKDAGSKERRTQPPIWPDDYDTSEQPNQPEELTPPRQARRSEKVRQNAEKEAKANERELPHPTATPQEPKEK